MFCYFRGRHARIWTQHRYGCVLRVNKFMFYYNFQFYEWTYVTLGCKQRIISQSPERKHVKENDMRTTDYLECIFGYSTYTHTQTCGNLIPLTCKVNYCNTFNIQWESYQFHVERWVFINIVIVLLSHINVFFLTFLLFFFYCIHSCMIFLYFSKPKQWSTN